MANSTAVNCTHLVYRRSFPSYIATIRDATAGDFSRVDECQAQVCNALWGSGNPDISGIGMMFGYALENLLGLVLSLAVFVLRLRQRKGPSAHTELFKRCTSVARKGCFCFYECAIFFTFSIQVACIVVLAQLDFGVSASGMGDGTAKITWAVSLVTMLPLTYMAFNPDLLRESAVKGVHGTKAQARVDRREQLRFFLFALCWMLFMYPFLSRMIETFGPSMIGGKDQVISIGDWGKIEAVCLSGVKSITTHETVAMKVFSIVGSLLVSVPALLSIIWAALSRQHGESQVVRYIQEQLSKLASLQAWIPMALFVAVPPIAVTQLWTAFRLRSFQAAVSQHSGNQDPDSQWTFGQIAAVTIFVPVVVECWFSWLYE